jgi:hypothetical protein
LQLSATRGVGALIAKRIAVVSLVSVFFLALLAHVCIEMSYASSKPRVRDMQAGRVLRMNIEHGSIVYVSPEELQTFRRVQEVAEIVMLISFAGIAILKLSLKDIWR